MVVFKMGYCANFVSMKLGISTWTKVGVALFVVGAAMGCRKTGEFPVEPQLTFKSFELFGDSASLTVSFTDGDGDIGLDASDNQTPFDTASAYYNNFFLEQEDLINGVWTPYQFPGLPLYYRIPRITPNGQNKTLEGDIAVAIDPLPLSISQLSDTVRFSVKIVDRALHESNVVYSNMIFVN